MIWNKKIDSIFGYVKPVYIFVTRNAFKKMMVFIESENMAWKLFTKFQEWMPFIFITTAIVITIVSVIMIRNDAIERDQIMSQMISDLADKGDQIVELNKHSVKLVSVKLVPVKLVSSCNYNQDLVEDKESEDSEDKESEDSEDEESEDSEDEEYEDSEDEEYEDSEDEEYEDEDPNDSDYDPEEDDF
jgi:hypothetical protein